MHDQFDRLKSALADRYAIERELDSGGMATVYLDEDLKLSPAATRFRDPAACGLCPRSKDDLRCIRFS